MITLSISTYTEVNEKQYKIIVARYSFAIGYSIKAEKYFIKPFLFLGYKAQIENQLNELN